MPRLINSDPQTLNDFEEFLIEDCGMEFTELRYDVQHALHMISEARTLEELNFAELLNPIDLCGPCWRRFWNIFGCNPMNQESAEHPPYTHSEKTCAVCTNVLDDCWDA